MRQEVAKAAVRRARPPCLARTLRQQDGGVSFPAANYLSETVHHDRQNVSEAAVRQPRPPRLACALKKYSLCQQRCSNRPGDCQPLSPWLPRPPRLARALQPSKQHAHVLKRQHCIAVTPSFSPRLAARPASTACPAWMCQEMHLVAGDGARVGNSRESVVGFPYDSGKACTW